MQAHADPRYKKRLPCRVNLGASQYSGLIMNLSRSGLFVQTGAGPAPGERVDVAVQAPTATPDIILTSRVVWKRVVPPQLRNTLAGGIGVEIQYAPEAYYSLLEAVERLQTQVPRVRRARGEGETDPGTTGPVLLRYRIRLQQIGAPRSRTLEVDATSEPDARRRALDLAGPDWSITQIDRPPARSRPA